MMIPGAWEPRPQSVAVVEPLAPASKPPAESRGGRGPALSETLIQDERRVEGSGLDTPHAELPGWLKVSIFAATLLVAMWLAMAVFFD